MERKIAMSKTLNQRPTGPNARPASKTLGGTSTPVSETSKAVVTAPVSETAGATGEGVTSVAAFVNFLRGVAEPFAIIDDNVVAKNMQLAGGYGMSAEDRTVSFECAEYLMSNLACILMGLVLDPGFKDTFIESLNVELEIDKKDEATRAVIRKSMKDDKPFDSLGSIIIGVTSFTPAVMAEFMAKMEAGFKTLDAYAKEFDDAVDALTEKQKLEYGFIVSNWMYLIRAFNKNDLFMSYVITVVEKVKGTLKIA
jgi:hypothetical protein